MLCTSPPWGLKTMSEQLKQKFEAAAKDVQTFTKRPDDEDMLRVYALFKQATEGDVSGDRPGAFSLVQRAKYDAWAKHKGTDAKTAMESYIKLIERLKRTYG